ncbi:MAG TPA: lysophospholipid acyltransferase family protein [Acidimicrobiales bacterium]
MEAPVLSRVARSVLGPVLRASYDVEVTGLGGVPLDRPVILAANHRSFMDSIFLPLVWPSHIAFIAKAEYFDHWSTAWFFRGTGQIPLRRGLGSAAGEALGAARNVLAAGGTIGIYPEGTRSRDGKLHRGNSGPARLALTSGAPIVPVGLVGTANVQAPGQKVPRPFRHVAVRFGPPQWVTSSSSDGVSDRVVLRDATDQLMRTIAGLCGQECVDRYAGRATSAA